MIKRFETRVTAYLSHRPRLYALIVGIGVVLFWRGVWHTADQVHTYFTFNTSIDWSMNPWWDGPLSLIAGAVILYFTGAFVSSFIGNELILSGLRGEKRLNEKTEEQVENEVSAISDIKNSLRGMERTIEQLEKKVLEHHQAHK
jgi:hypothetical protein